MLVRRFLSDNTERKTNPGATIPGAPSEVEG